MVRIRRGGRWQPAVPLSEPGPDLYRTSACFDGFGTLLVVASAQRDGNWDLYCWRLHGGRWTGPERLTEWSEPDMHQQLVRADDGAVWLLWQWFRDGQSDVLARRWDGKRWSEKLVVSESLAND